MAKVALGSYDEGIARLQQAVTVTHRGPYFLGLLGWALTTAGRKDEARALLEELRARPAEAPTVVPEAWLMGALGELDAAFGVLARAESEKLSLCFTGFPAFDVLAMTRGLACWRTNWDCPRGKTFGAAQSAPGILDVYTSGHDILSAQ